VAIRGHDNCVKQQKIEKYVRKYGAQNKLRLRLIRIGRMRPKRRNRVVYKIFKWLGVKSSGGYIDLKMTLWEESE